MIKHPVITTYPTTPLFLKLVITTFLYLLVQTLKFKSKAFIVGAEQFTIRIEILYMSSWLFTLHIKSLLMILVLLRTQFQKPVILFIMCQY